MSTKKLKQDKDLKSGWISFIHLIPSTNYSLDLLFKKNLKYKVNVRKIIFIHLISAKVDTKRITRTYAFGENVTIMC